MFEVEVLKMGKISKGEQSQAEKNEIIQKEGCKKSRVYCMLGMICLDEETIGSLKIRQIALKYEKIIELIIKQFWWYLSCFVVLFLIPFCVWKIHQFVK